ncbi:hypothetical protein BH10PSE14_BH10PSE14_04970 [soil metagenome]
MLREMAETARRIVQKMLKPSPREQAHLALLREAVSQRPNSPELLYALADALAERAAYDEYADVFRRAYQARPCANPDLICQNGQSQREAAISLRARSNALLTRGVLFSQVIAAQVIADAILGNVGDVAYLMDYDSFLRCETVEPPVGCDRKTFHENLVDEIKSGMTFFGRKKNAAMNDAWWHVDLLRPERSTAWQLREIIRSRVERYIAELPARSDHPFVRSAPSAFKIAGWALVSGGNSYHVPHIHPEAWLSGIYYVVRPPASRQPGNVGWLRMGPRASLGLTPADGWQERFIAPEPGTLVLMPGYFVHDTEPMGVDEERICIAFDILPLELAGLASESGSA